MIELAGKPILWHIMKIYSFYGFNEFIILCGYKGYIIKEYFANYYTHMADMTIDLNSNTIQYHKNKSEPWKITLIDTGENTMTGGRVKRAAPYIGNETFMLTYGDGIADININELIDFHKKHKKALTMTSVQPEGRFGSINVSESNRVTDFTEKPKGDGHWINGGFFVCEPKVLEYIEGDEILFEKQPLENLAKDRELYTFHHNGFWKPMDTLRDKFQLEELIENNTAPWIKW